MFKLALFDLDGTLIEPEVDYFIKEAERLFSHFGFSNITPEQIRSAIRRGSHFEFFPEENREEHIEKFWNDYREELYPHPRILEGNVLQTLRTVQEMGMKTAIVTFRSHSVEYLKEILAPTGILEYMDLVLTMGKYAFSSKDKSLIANQAMEFFSCTPEETFIIGDSPADIKTARAANLKLAISVLTGGLDTDYLMECQPDHTLSHVDELPGLLKSLM